MAGLQQTEFHFNPVCNTKLHYHNLENGNDVSEASNVKTANGSIFPNFPIFM